MNRFLAATLGLAATLILTGCPRNEYVVEMKSVGNALERRVTCGRYDINGETRTPLDFPEPELASLKALYPKHAFDEANKRHTFQGLTIRSTPNDIGGAGSYVLLKTSFGSVGNYVERFRGHDDQWTRLQRRAKSVDQFIDLLLGWLETELGRDPGFPKLRRFLDGQARHDLKNGSLMIYQVELAEQFKKDASEEFVIRAFQYFLERGYFHQEETAQVLGFIRGSNQKEESLNFVRRWLAERLGLSSTAAMPAFFAFLNDSEAIEASWTKYMRSTDLFKSRLKEWEADHARDPKIDPLDPAQVGTDVALGAIEFQSATLDQLKVKLTLPLAPFSSNGKWDEASKNVLWEASIGTGQSRELPAICYAAWAEPDSEFQTRHLGKVALRGKDLGQIVLWRVNLPENQGGEWDRFLTGLKPGQNLEKGLDAFRFPGEIEGSPSKAADAVDLIKGGLRSQNKD